jgi:hypothetical protein
MKLKLPDMLEKFNFYVTKLQKYEGTIELKKIQRPRTLQQNKYLHVCISVFAIETGYTLDEAKTLLKRECGFMVYEKRGQKFLKNTSDMDTKELTDFIEWIRNYAGANNIYIQSSEDYLRNWEEIEHTIEQNKQFL